MGVEKTVSISFRISPRIKGLLDAAAAKENRNLTNMFETLVLDYCEKMVLADTAPTGRTVTRGK